MRRRTIWLAVLALAGLLALLLVGVVLLPRLLYPPLSRAELQGVPTVKERIELQQAQSELQNNARIPLLQGLGGLLLVVGVIATWQQVLIGREGQITDRFTRATDQLGSDKLDVRIGGILALERIAKDSERDQERVTQLLEAFVRAHAPGQFDTSYPTSAVDEQLPWLRDRAPDVQISLNKLGRTLQPRTYEPPHLPYVDLRHAHFSEYRFSGATLWRANLTRARMRRIHLENGELGFADLRKAVIENGVLTNANLSHACLDEADLQGANLQRAVFVEASLRNANLRDANLRAARLDKADLRETDLRGADLRQASLEQTDLTGAYDDATTTWPEGFDIDRYRAAVIVTEAAAPNDAAAVDSD